MNFDIQKAVRYIFDDKDWIKKVGILIGIQVVLSLINNGFKFAWSFMPDSSFLGELDPAFLSMLSMVAMPFYAISVFGLISIPVKIYISAYTLETTLNVMNGDQVPIPFHENFTYKLKLWFGKVLVNLGPMILFAIVGFAILTALFTLFGLNSYGDHEIFNPIYMLGVLFLILLIGFLWLILQTFILTPMLYIFLRSGSITASYDPNSVMEIVRVWWKELTILSILQVVIVISTGLLSMFACFFSFLVSPALTLIGTFVGAHLIGQLFERIKNAESGTNGVSEM